MRKASRTPGICRIDQPEKRTHGFFVRVQRRGKICSGFFTDLRYGGKAKALAAAELFRDELVKVAGPSALNDRKAWAQIPRRPGASKIVGVQKVVDRRTAKPQIYWRATWSPVPGVVQKKLFSVSKWGARKAKELAIKARRAGVRSMVPY